MPKELLNINPFDGGMNTHSDARDLEENELALVENAVISHKGKIISAYMEADSTVADKTASNIPVSQYFWRYKTDYTHANAEGSTEYLLLSNGQYLWRLENGAWVEKIDLGAAISNALPSLSIYDGQVRFSDGTFAIDGNNQPTNKTQISGTIRRKYFNGADSISSLSENAEIIKPDDGSVGFDAYASSLTQGYLGLRVDKKENALLQDKSFTSSSSFTSTLYSNEFSPYTFFTNSDNFFNHVGGASMSSTGVNDTYGESYSFSDISSPTVTYSNGGIESTFDDAGDYIRVYMSIDPDVKNANWGTFSRYVTMVIYGTVYKDDGDETEIVNWDTVEYYVEKQNENGSWSQITAGSSPNDGLVNTGSDDSHLTLGFQNSSSDKFRVKLSESAGYGSYTYDFRITSAKLYIRHSMYNNDRYLRVAGKNDSSPKSRVNFADFFSPSHLNNDNLISVQVAIGDKSTNLIAITLILNSTGFESNGWMTDPQDSYRYVLGTDWISENRNKGWKEVLIDFDEISDIEGSPTPPGAVNFAVQIDSNSDEDVPEVAIDGVKIIKDERGTWDGKYKFFYSWIYDRIQESGFFEFPSQGNGIELVNQRITAKSLIREVSTGGFGGGGKRITGANIYFAEYDTTTTALKYDDPFKLMECDFERGVTKSGGNTIEIWSDETINSISHKTHDTYEFIDPVYSSSFSISSGYDYNPAESIANIRSRAMAVLDRKIYYGNVDITYEKVDGENYALREKHGDRVYKSLANKPDIVPAYNYIDVAMNDGDEITAMIGYADRLLVFKSDVMYLINATKDLEYLEDTYKFKGAWNQMAVTQTDKGVAWANEYGCFHYDGDDVKNLSDQKIDQGEWVTTIGTKPSIVFEPKERHIIVLGSSTTNGWAIDLDLEGWTKLSGVKTATTSNNIIYGGDIVYSLSSGGDMVMKKLDYIKSSGTSSKIKINTRDMDFGSAGQLCDIKKVYVSYKGTAGNMTLHYLPKSATDDGETHRSFTGSFGTKTEVSTQAFVPTTSSQAKKLHSFQLVFNKDGADIPMDFELHDITVVYRKKIIK